ncbi:odorant receptor 46a-like [Harpegnathos saltator]|uniref:odorant receptor 46a-like n=1 Tax=Harpegnathos saltator TaxID=610380 RepID=UPI000DBED52E|nr:odorant receptor 46a-like [Harpegnathos saltator]
METREMRVMRFTLSILALAGCWRPFSWTSLVKHVLYNIYTLLVISVLYSFTFSQFMEIVLNVSNPNDFTNILYTMMAMIVACCKVLSMWMNHESFVVLIRKLNEGTFRPLVPAEREIRRKCDETIRYARMVNTRFTGIILFQFVTSTFVICSNLYQLTKTTIGMYHIALITYTFCVMAQIFLYCWFGNKLKVTVRVSVNLCPTTRLFLIKRSLEMRVLRLTLRIVMFAGCFRPLSWLSRFKRTAYNIYRTLIITFLYTFATLQFMDIVLKVDNPDDFTDNLYMMLNVSVSGYKLFIMWVNYEDIVTIIKSLTEEPLKPLDPGEMEIRCKFDSLIRANTLRYALLIETSWTCTGLTSLLVDFRQGRLTYREWVPYDYYASYALFFVTYAHQFLSTFYCATVNVACDTLICGLLMHVCCQMEILEYRLKKISQQDDLSYCIRHHNSIFQFARAVNEGFARIIEFQFVTSTLIICSNLFQLSKSTMGANNIALVVYTCCMLTEIFIYCWFGNRVKSKSLQLADSVFQLHWLPLNNSVKKSLLIIMKRATVPIEIVTAYILPLNLDSFVAILKTSYSAYNLLVQAQE